MLLKIWRHCQRRNFSKSTAWKNTEKKLPETTTPPEPSPIPNMQLTTIPTELDKKALLFSGRYKTREEIPERVGYELLNKAKSKCRIKIANYMMVVVVIACVYYGWVGKQDSKRGQTIHKQMLDKEAKILAEAGKK